MRYHCACHAQKQSQREIADKMAHMLTSPLDFPRLVHQVYADGARVFIEAGAGGNCARWIDESLKGSPHLALSMNRRGTDDYHHPGAHAGAAAQPPRSAGSFAAVSSC